MKWDIFCKVVDNFGDIGVCWRLSRQLAAEYGFVAVRLWVDAPEALRPLLSASEAADFAPGQKAWEIAGVQVCDWREALEFGGVAEVVLETFACELPDAYLAAMAARPTPPVWINLEYLSAEDWVAECHGLPSPHPRLPLVKHFFFPGFAPEKTGGLLRERDLLARQSAFLGQIGREKWLADICQSAIPARDGIGFDAPLLVSLFCYDTAPVRALMEAWRQEASPLLCLVPPGKPLAAVQAVLGGDGPWTLEHTRIVPIPFLSQTAYDELLWVCDLNFVRGEDSFVRAQWAGQPLVWQVYPQADNAHRIKLDAFLTRYAAALPPEAQEDCIAFWQDWNGAGEHLSHLWPRLRQQLPRLRTHAQQWRQQLATMDDLAATLVRFCKSRV
ncbi:MAG: elongation factor P maturation arginine rhamnosyltransferase EarP [Zoogloeaceae bacterium]|jgi:uncharacterized repeat protein (TIGR03837 family)|nr:elongation factor P maturation arginine rhamnosyltransferase EarP [Zoogloeaceae bacterium]